MEFIKKCNVCGEEHTVLPTVDLSKKVVGSFCPIKKRMYNVSTTYFNGVDIEEAVRGLIPLHININNLHKIHDDSIYKLSKKIAYEFLITPLGKSKPFNFYFTQYHAYNVLKKYKAKGLTA